MKYALYTGFGLTIGFVTTMTCNCTQIFRLWFILQFLVTMKGSAAFCQESARIIDRDLTDFKEQRISYHEMISMRFAKRKRHLVDCYGGRITLLKFLIKSINLQ